MTFASPCCTGKLNLLLALLTVLIFVPSTTHAISNRTRQAYVSLLYGDTYALAVRVSMHSLLRNSPDVSSGTRDRVVLATGTTSAAAKRQLLSEGIRVITVPELETPYSKDPKFRERFALVMTKLLIFNLTQYHSVVFLDADTLVLGDLSPLFSCGSFCAVFINPCHFNAGMMHVVPNTTLFNDLVKQLPHLPSYDGGDQGFLNSYFTEMSQAPLFDPAEPALPPASMNRLLFNWHVDHSSFFPSFDFAFTRSDRCGEPRVVEWLGPPLLKPWLWWTYGLLDLSWRWLEYREELPNAFPPSAKQRESGILLVAAVYVGLFILARLCYARSIQPLPPLFTTLSRVAMILPRPSSRLSAAFAVLIGLPLWGFGFAMAVFAVPQLLQPFPASFVFMHMRTAFSLLTLLLVGPGLSLRGTAAVIGRHSAPLKAAKARRLTIEMCAMSVLDAVYIVVWVALLWQLPFSGLVQKGFVCVLVGLSNVALVAALLGRTSLMWLRFADELNDDIDTATIPSTHPSF